jgi:pyridoxine 5-phosphate synthase
LGVNAGHDLNLSNLTLFKRAIPQLLEVSIGHAFTVDCIEMGLSSTVTQYQQALGKVD